MDSPSHRASLPAQLPQELPVTGKAVTRVGFPRAAYAHSGVGTLRVVHTRTHTHTHTHTRAVVPLQDVLRGIFPHPVCGCAE